MLDDRPFENSVFLKINTPDEYSLSLQSPAQLASKGCSFANLNAPLTQSFDWSDAGSGNILEFCNGFNDRNKKVHPF